LKGFPEGVQAYRVIGESAVPSRFEALHAAGTIRLVGRDQEIRLLQQRWNLASRATGRSYMCWVRLASENLISLKLCARDWPRLDIYAFTTTAPPTTPIAPFIP
jgi:hypothetical protein